MTVQPLRILMIDDSDIILEQSADALTAAGFEVFTTTQTFAARRLMKGVALVIIDYHMPGTDGAELLKSLRAQATADSNSECRFFLYTGDGAVARAYRSHGFDGALVKGDSAALVSGVRNIARVRALGSNGAGAIKKP